MVRKFKNMYKNYGMNLVERNPNEGVIFANTWPCKPDQITPLIKPRLRDTIPLATATNYCANLGLKMATAWSSYAYGVINSPTAMVGGDILGTQSYTDTRGFTYLFYNGGTISIYNTQMEEIYHGNNMTGTVLSPFANIAGDVVVIAEHPIDGIYFSISNNESSITTNQGLTIFVNSKGVLTGFNNSSAAYHAHNLSVLYDDPNQLVVARYSVSNSSSLGGTPMIHVARIIKSNNGVTNTAYLTTGTTATHDSMVCKPFTGEDGIRYSFYCVANDSGSTIRYTSFNVANATAAGSIEATVPTNPLNQPWAGNNAFLMINVKGSHLVAIPTFRRFTTMPDEDTYMNAYVYSWSKSSPTTLLYQFANVIYDLKPTAFMPLNSDNTKIMINGLAGSAIYEWQNDSLGFIKVADLSPNQSAFGIDSKGRIWGSNANETTLISESDLSGVRDVTLFDEYFKYTGSDINNKIIANSYDLAENRTIDVLNVRLLGNAEFSTGLKVSEITTSDSGDTEVPIIITGPGKITIVVE